MSENIKPSEQEKQAAIKCVELMIAGMEQILNTGQPPRRNGVEFAVIIAQLTRHEGKTASYWHAMAGACGAETRLMVQRAEAAEADAKEWRERFQRCSTERQELEAQVAALREALADCRATLSALKPESGPIARQMAAAIERTTKDMNATATTAAQHDARVKAEALREAITDLCGNAHRSPIEVLRDRAAEIEKGVGL